jgi:hypothetical protein
MVRRELDWDVIIVILCPQEAEEAMVEGQGRVEWVAAGVREGVLLSITAELKM